MDEDPDGTQDGDRPRVRPSWESPRPAQGVGGSSAVDSPPAPAVDGRLEVRVVHRVSGQAPDGEDGSGPRLVVHADPAPRPSSVPATEPAGEAAGEAAGESSIEPVAEPVAVQEERPFGRPDLTLPGTMVLGDTRISNRTAGIFAVVALVPVISAIGVAVIIGMGTGNGDAGDSGDRASSSSSDGSGASDGSGSSGGSGDAPVQQPAGVRKAPLDDAADALRGAGVRRIGKVEGAWAWRDGSTDTMVVLSRRVTRRNGDFSARAVALRATTITDPGGSPKVLATIEDDGTTCPSGTEMKAEIGPANATVKDLDGDGVHEVVVTWRHACGSDVRRQVTVLAGPTPYVLAGQGALTAEPDPPIADWPDGFLDAASALLDRA